MSLDLRFCQKVVESEEIEWVRSSGIEEEMFMDEGREVYDFIIDFFSEYGETPTKDTVEKETGEELYFDNIESRGYYIDQIKERHLERKLGEGLEDVIYGPLEEGEAESALSDLRDLAVDLDKMWEGVSVGERGLNLSRESGGERILERYEEYSDMNMDYGVHTPWEWLTDAIKGWRPGSLNIITAETETGKTWMLCLCALKAVEENERVVMVSMEMPSEEIAERLVCLESGVSYSRYLDGELGQGGVKSVENAIERLRGKDLFRIVDMSSVSSVEDTEMEIMQYAPDLVLVDGIYVMNQSKLSRASTWERVMTVAGELKKLAIRRDVAVIGTTQFNRDKSSGSSGNISQLAYAKAIGEQADVCISLFQDEDLELNDKLAMDIIKGRHVKKEKKQEGFTVNWDIDGVNFEPEENDPFAGSGGEEEEFDELMGTPLEE